MKVVVIGWYGGSDVLNLREVPTPAAGPGEVLIGVRAAGVSPVDWEIRRGDVGPFTPRSFPFIPGADVAGEMETVGPGATRFHPGDAIYALCGAEGGGATRSTSRSRRRPSPASQPRGVSRRRPPCPSPAWGGSGPGSQPWSTGPPAVSATWPWRSPGPWKPG